jgi:hypothetical protein
MFYCVNGREEGLDGALRAEVHDRCNSLLLIVPCGTLRKSSRSVAITAMGAGRAAIVKQVHGYSDGLYGLPRMVVERFCCRVGVCGIK